MTVCIVSEADTQCNVTFSYNEALDLMRLGLHHNKNVLSANQIKIIGDEMSV